MHRINVLYIGKRDHPEFRAATRWLAEHTALRSVSSMDAAKRHLTAQLVPTHVIVLAEVRPGQFQTGQIDHLRRLSPLARVFGLLGSWCEGELRSGLPWPGVNRLFWHQWPSRFARETAAFIDGRCPIMGSPVTATMDEDVLRLRNATRKSRRGLVVIHADDEQTVRSLQDMCCHVGYATVCAVREDYQRTTGAAAVLWDLCHSRDIQIDRLREMSRQYAPTPIVVLSSFPRSDIVKRLSAAGAATIVSKPFLLDDLFWELDLVISQSRVGTLNTAA